MIIGSAYFIRFYSISFSSSKSCHQRRIFLVHVRAAFKIKLSKNNYKSLERLQWIISFFFKTCNKQCWKKRDVPIMCILTPVRLRVGREGAVPLLLSRIETAFFYGRRFFFDWLAEPLIFIFLGEKFHQRPPLIWIRD